jgi:hypothetical protein
MFLVAENYPKTYTYTLKDYIVLLYLGKITVGGITKEERGAYEISDEKNIKLHEKTAVFITYED